MTIQRWWYPTSAQPPDPRANPNLADVFANSVDWEPLEGYIDVMGFYIDSINKTDKGGIDYLPDALDRVAQMSAAICIESGGPLGNNGSVTCGTGPVDNATQSVAAELAKVSRIYALGAHVDYLQLDTISRTILGGLGSSCGFTMVEAAEAIVVYMQEWHNVHPETKIGIIPQLSNWQSTYTGALKDAYTPSYPYVTIDDFLDEFYNQVLIAGERVEHLHPDTPWEYLQGYVPSNTSNADDWWQRNKDARDQYKAAFPDGRFGVPLESLFGGGLTGSPLTPYPSDWLYQNNGLLYFNKWLALYGTASLDDLIVQSFYIYPQQWTQNGDRTSMADMYFQMLNLYDGIISPSPIGPF